MKNDPQSSRLKSLDGIRGLAILAVLFNHIPPAFALSVLPALLVPFSGIIFASGVLGVSFLFVLSGFLMAYIYPNPKSGLWFLQKRYTRIFPLFLTMSVVMLLFRVFPMLVGIWGILLILVLAIIVNFIWIHFVKKMPAKFGKSLFFSFLLMQIFAGGFYLFWVMRHPPIVFNQQIPPLIREGTIGLVNSTLTLPLGNYIPMLDGVYWSLAAEVLFYILYPVICVPVINYLSTKSKLIKYLFLLTLLPFVAGADLLSHKLFGLSMLQLPLFYCFVTGMALGYLYKRKPEAIHRLTGILKGKLSLISILIFIGVVYFYHLTLDNQTPWAAWLHILWAIPFALVIAISLDHRNLLSKMFSSKILVFLGLVSYSIYLSHTSVVHILETLLKPTSVISSATFIILTVTVTIILSRILYRLLEKPYFMRPKEAKTIAVNTNSNLVKPAFLTLSIICVIYILATFNAYQSSFNFFSIEYPSSQVVFISPQIKPGQNYLSLKTYPVIDMQIYSPEDNLGIIVMHLTAQNSMNKLIFRIKEKGARDWYATTGYRLSTVGDSKNHPFGFPVIPDSKGKTYEIQLSLPEIKTPTPEYAWIETTPSSIRNVYPVNKTQLVKNPRQLFIFVEKKTSNVFSNLEAQEVLIFLCPLLLLSLFLFLPKRSKVLIGNDKGLAKLLGR
jgi:peptidoglycan/LPS O-acetylase OafA/YrhL